MWYRWNYLQSGHRTFEFWLGQYRYFLNWYFLEVLLLHSGVYTA